MIPAADCRRKLDVVQRYWITPLEAPPIVAWKPQPCSLSESRSVKREVVKEVPKPDPVPDPVVVPAEAENLYTGCDGAGVQRPREESVLAPDMTPKLRRHSLIPRLHVHGQFRDSHVEETARGSADGRLRRSQWRAGQRQDRPAANINVLGGYDMPTGPGNGNGTGGAKGAKGVIASTGFGNGVAVGSPGGAPHGTVQQGGFGDESAAVAAAPKVKQTAAQSRTPSRWRFS